MKHFATFLLLSVLAVPPLALADDDDKRQKQRAKTNAALQRIVDRNAAAASARQRRVQQPVQRKRNANPAIVQRQPRIKPSANVGVANANVGTTQQVNRGRRSRGRANWNNNARINNPRVRPRTDSSVSVNDWQNRSGSNSEWNRKRWSHRHNWDRRHRNRSWWRSNYTRFALFGGGYYYWNGGYWYPAYGYDPYFTTYVYDAPIYAYNDQDPGQVIADVQAALNQRGYHAGPIDGTYGPMTRRALLNFQRDHGLPVNGQIDQATLDALGFR